MANLFSYDSPIIQFLNKAVDCFFLSLLWLIFSLPIITMGPATCALYYTANKVLRHNRSHILTEFWRSFKDNFKQGLVIGIILLVFYTVMLQNIYMYYLGLLGNIGKTVFYINIVMGLFAIPWILFIISSIARFKNRLFVIIKNALLISLRHLFVSILLLLLVVAAVVVMWLFLPSIFIMPALFMLVATFLIEPVYRRYMSDEDLEAENERNMVYYN